MIAGKRTLWTFVVTTIALFMVVLDNLVVSTAIPAIRTDLGASLEELEWTVNAFTLTFAVFLTETTCLRMTQPGQRLAQKCAGSS
jgi:MFS family permease